MCWELKILILWPRAINLQKKIDRRTHIVNRGSFLWRIKNTSSFVIAIIQYNEQEFWRENRTPYLLPFYLFLIIIIRNSNDDFLFIR